MALATLADLTVDDSGWIGFLVDTLWMVEMLLGGGDVVETFLGSDERELWKFASPITHVSQASPPLLLIAW